ncbi:MAG: electron transfer flavoprotein subunit alpha/FixB family protein [Bryobacteraceae bacterium]
MKVLVLIHTDDTGAPGRAGLEAVAAARLLGGDLTIGLVGAAVDATLLAGAGASQVLAVAGPEFGVSRYATDRAAALALLEAAAPEVILAAGTERWRRTLPGVAGTVDSHVTGIELQDGEIRAHRWYYRQRMEAAFTRTVRPWMLLIEPGAFLAFSGSGEAPAIELLSSPAVTTRTRVEGFVSPPAGEQTIRPEADVLLVAGAGWTKKQKDGQPHVDRAAVLILDFLRQTRASLGSSKSLVDLSGEGQTVLPFLTHLNQVGQTGATPRHPKGLATCCHGEEPHVVGWRFVSERRAVNLDPNCGWAHGKADVLYVADAFEVMEKVNALLGARTAG